MRVSLRGIPAPVRIAAAIAGLALLALLQLTTCSPDPAPYVSPPAVVRAESSATLHQVATAVDTSQIRQLRERAAAALAASVRAERGAARARTLADSLAAVAALQGDSAREWRGAYHARTRERDNLLTALVDARDAQVSTDSALARSERRAARGDDALADALLAMRGLERDLAKRDRRSWREKLRPRVIVGPAATIAPDGRVRAGIAVGLGWAIPP